MIIAEPKAFAIQSHCMKFGYWILHVHQKRVKFSIEIDFKASNDEMENGIELEK